MPIPKEWGNYSPIGTRMTGTPFICTKTPLGEPSLKSKFVVEEWHRVEDLLKKCKAEGDLHLVINLCGTLKYYDVEKRRIQHIWLACHGVDAPNQHEEFAEFVRIVDKFRADFADDDRAMMAVHCTHGVNRTGFMVCKYLMQEMKWTAKRAMDAFEHHRGHPIKRQEYIDALYALETTEKEGEKEVKETSDGGDKEKSEEKVDEASKIVEKSQENTDAKSAHTPTLDDEIAKQMASMMRS